MYSDFFSPQGFTKSWRASIRPSNWATTPSRYFLHQLVEFFFWYDGRDSKNAKESAQLGTKCSVLPPVGQLRGDARPERGRAAGFRGADGEEASGGPLHRIHALRR